MSSSRSNPRSARNGPVLSNYSSFSRSPAISSNYPGGSYFASSTASLTSSPSFNIRSTSPTRVHFAGSLSSSASVRFSLDSRPTSPGRSISYVPAKKPSAPQRKTCMCSPTTHPGSFRCSLHKGFSNQSPQQNNRISNSSTRLNARRSAMANSLVRIGTVEGDLVKRALAALIRPSSHQQRRRAAFQPRPSRLSNMSKAE